MGIPILVLAVAGYAATATAYGEARRRGAPPPAWARHAGIVVVAAHLIGLFALASQVQRSPFSTGSQALSFLAFALGALYVVLERTSRVATHGWGFYALAALLAALSVPGLIERPLSDVALAPREASRTIHVGLSLLSSAAVFAAALLAVAYLTAYRRMKRGATPTAEGPSLIGLERLARISTLLALALLLPALIVGFGVPIKGTAGWLLTATSSALVLLMAFAFGVWWRRPRQGALAAWVTLCGAVLLVVAAGIAHPMSLPGGTG